MDGKSVKKRVDTYVRVINECLQASTFTLNKRAAEAQREILKLQKICPHQYNDDGKCIYCGKDKETEK